MTDTFNILVVEDKEADQYVARRRLAKRWPDACIHCVPDGIEAIRHLESEAAPPDLILLDINMPRMDGHEFLASWFGQKGVVIPIVLMLTSSTQEEDRQRVASYPNVCGFASKPLEPGDLDKLSVILGEKKSGPQSDAA